MSEDGAASSAAPARERLCRYCRQPVHPEATKCHHCGEILTAAQRVRALATRVGALVGLTAAGLSLFYALREGWFWVEERQRERAAFESYAAAAERFAASDSLEHAAWALGRAAQLRPNDTAVRVRHFQLSAHRILREVEDWPGRIDGEGVQEAVIETIREGVALLQAPLAPEQRADILVMVARAVALELTGEQSLDVSAILEEAQRTAPEDPEVAFHLGEWLVSSEGDRVEEGVALLARATELEPNDPRYWATLGTIQRKRGHYGEAARAQLRAWKLRPEQKELQRIRAANGSVADLGVTLSAASDETEITSEDFFGLSFDERLAMLDEVIEHASVSKSTAWTAARFYESQGLLDQSEQAMRRALTDDDLDTPARYFDEARLGYYAELLEKLGGQHERLATVRRMLVEKREDLLYEEILEIGSGEDGTWRMGLKTLREPTPEGLGVVEAVADYPFGKAGVTAGDHIVEFGHSEVQSLHDIVRRLVGLRHGSEAIVRVRRDGALVDLVMTVE